MELFDDRVLIKPDEEEKISTGGIIIPETARQQNKFGTVIKCGQGHTDERTGEFTSITVKEGDRVIFDAAADYQQSEEWCNLLLMRESDVLTIIKS